MNLEEKTHGDFYYINIILKIGWLAGKNYERDSRKLLYLVWKNERQRVVFASSGPRSIRIH
jgi:hypothetical protein